MNIAQRDTNVVTFTGGRMTEAEYDRERSRFARNKNEAGIRWEQQLATLFYRSGWTHGQLAKKEKMSRSHIAELLQFGRFLNSAEIPEGAENILNNLNQHRFNQYWRRTEEKGSGHGNLGNERIRFRQVIELMREHPDGFRSLAKGAGTKIRELFADGKWHSLEAIEKKIGGGQALLNTLDHLYSRRVGNYGLRTERKTVGTHWHYRFFPQDKTVSVKELIEKLTPIVKGLLQEGRKNMATMSPPTVAHLAGLLRNLLDEWAAE